jgi:ParB family transcriptional regulator, chromosome partitioning protein
MFMQAQKRRLGRGLAALIGDDQPDEAVAAAVSEASGLRQVAVELISRNLANPRKYFAEDELQNLAQSIREKGLLQPLVVRPKGNGHYELVAGERRWRASQLAQLHMVPVVVRELDDRESLEIALIENIQRADLNPLEEAMGYKQLMDSYHYTQQQLADGLGKSRSHIANTMRLMNLPESVRAKIQEGVLTAGHARTLVASDSPHELAEKIIRLGLSVRQAEELARSQPLHQSKAPKKNKDADTRALEKELSGILGLGVAVSHRGEKGGQLTISYKTLEQLEDVAKRLRN